jgi:SpoVK/Ycf46/Vps4 family AAA+-type ATPase
MLLTNWCEVAEELRRPLYTISGEELGDAASIVEERLKRILATAEKWNAILLLDECDVFLESRTINSLQRNSYVAVFLRLLEYYKGILFMTTNRQDSIDAAFKSRIHLTIVFPDLSVSTRKQIWTRFVHSCENTLAPRDFDTLSNIEMNGREIKNMVKTGQLLAKRENKPLSIDHFKIVLSASNHRTSGFLSILGYNLSNFLGRFMALPMSIAGWLYSLVRRRQ